MKGKGMALAAAAFLLAAGLSPASEVENRLAAKVRHEILMLPWYGVFDAISYEVKDGTVRLTGEVTRPTLKSGIGKIVARLEGVERVVNDIEVLPLSPYDDRIRLAVLRAVYGDPALQRYGMPVQAPIRIIVRNGQVELKGVVDNEADRNLALIRANGVAGVFAVENRLLVAGRKG
jgi:hyperosmotically inducible protein